MSNFIDGLLALTSNIRLIFFTTFYNKGLLGFFGGAILTVLVTVFILTKNPKSIPIMLRYSSTDSFAKLATQDSTGSYTQGFTDFLRLYSQVRILCLMAFIAFCVMVTTVVLSRQP